MSERQNQYLDFLIDANFQRVNRLFILLFENEDDRKVRTRYYLPRVEIKDYNFMTNKKNFFEKPVKSDTATYDNIQKIATGQGDDYAAGSLMDYNYFNKHYKIIATNKRFKRFKCFDLSNQQAFYADPKAAQEVNFTGNLERDEGATMFFIIK